MPKNKENTKLFPSGGAGLSGQRVRHFFEKKKGTPLTP
jgi:hypothetical protein